MSQQINLYNPLFRKKSFSPTSANAMLYGVGIIAACCAVFGVYQDNRTRAVERNAQAVAQQHAEATANRDKLAAQLELQKPNAELAAELNQLEARLKGRQEVVDALKSGAIGSTAGFSPYMAAFSRQTINGLWLTGFDIASAGNEFTIEGRTLSADLLPVYLSRLNSETTLQGRQFAAMRIAQPPAAPVAPGAPPAAAPAPAPRDDLRAAAEALLEGGSGESRPAATAGTTPAPNRPAAPRYLDFTISTGEISESTQRPGMQAAAQPVAPVPAPVAAVPGGAPSTAAVLDAATRAAGGKAGAAK